MGMVLFSWVSMFGELEVKHVIIVGGHLRNECHFFWVHGE